MVPFRPQGLDIPAAQALAPAQEPVQVPHIPAAQTVQVLVPAVPVVSVPVVSELTEAQEEQVVWPQVPLSP